MKVSAKHFKMRLFGGSGLFLSSMIASLCITANPVFANVSHVVENGYLIGANNVDVGGVKYDVRFSSNTFVSLFSGAPMAFQSSPELAQEASYAMLNQVFVDGPAGDFSRAPGRVAGCWNAPYTCYIYTPWRRFLDNATAPPAEMVALSLLFVSSTDWADPNFDQIIYSNEFALDQGSGYRTWAVWSLSTVAAIPEPQTYALALAGLSVVGWMARRRRA